MAQKILWRFVSKIILKCQTQKKQVNALTWNGQGKSYERRRNS